MARRDQTLRYRLEVVALTADEAVRAAGGLVCDRSLDGWAVTARLAHVGDASALRVLGAKVIDLRAVPVWHESAPGPHALAVSAQLCSDNRRLREWVLDAPRRGCFEVVVWGPVSGSDFDRPLDMVEHQLTVAARAYKSYALASLAGAGMAGAAEQFQIGRPWRQAPWPRDLAPAS